jgi:hypothetical protein
MLYRLIAFLIINIVLSRLLTYIVAAAIFMAKSLILKVSFVEITSTVQVIVIASTSISAIKATVFSTKAFMAKSMASSVIYIPVISIVNTSISVATIYFIIGFL